MNMTIDSYSKWKYKKPANMDSSIRLKEEQETPLSGWSEHLQLIPGDNMKNINSKIKLN